MPRGSNLYRQYHVFGRNLMLIYSGKFLKDKIARARRASAIWRCLLYQIARYIMLLLVDNVHEKTSQTVLTDINFGSAHALIGNLHSCYDFPLVLHENVLVFSQSDARNFFKYRVIIIITIIITIRIIIKAELAERSAIIIQNGSSNLPSRKNLDLWPYDRTTVRPTVQDATFNMRGQLYCGYANATALSNSLVFRFSVNKHSASIKF